MFCPWRLHHTIENWRFEAWQLVVPEAVCYFVYNLMSRSLQASYTSTLYHRVVSSYLLAPGISPEHD